MRCAGLFGSSADPSEVTVNVTKGDQSFSFASKAYQYKGVNGKVSGLALEIDEDDKGSDNLQFFTTVGARASELGAEKGFWAVDNRLVDNCEFAYRYASGVAEFAFTVNGAEDSQNDQFDVSVLYSPSVDVDVIRSVNDLVQECENRNELIRKAKLAYWNAGQDYFNQKTQYEQALVSIDSKLKDDLNNAEEELKKAKSDYQKALDEAKAAADNSKTEAAKKFENDKSLFDNAKNNFVSVVPSVKSRVESAHIASSIDSLRSKIADIVCRNCDLKSKI